MPTTTTPDEKQEAFEVGHVVRTRYDAFPVSEKVWGNSQLKSDDFVPAGSVVLICRKLPGFPLVRVVLYNEQCWCYHIRNLMPLEDL